MNSSTTSVSSSLSTGGAGPFFERDVAAYWFAQLLLGWIPPILIDTTVIGVSSKPSISAGKPMTSSSPAKGQAGHALSSPAR